MMNNREAKEASLLDSFTKAGIGSEYHYRHLSDFDPKLFEGVKGDIREGAKVGRGYIFIGGQRAYDSTILVARALHMQGVKSFVIGLPRLVTWLDILADDLALVEEAQALFVTGFVNAGERPITLWQAEKVRDIVTERLDSGKAFFAQAERTPVGSGWWSETFTQRLTSACTIWDCSREPRTVATSRSN